MNTILRRLLTVWIPFGVFSAGAQTISPLTTFGDNGWIAPGSYAYLTASGNNERGLAFGNDHLYLASRDNVNGNALNIRILDPQSGADVGGLNTGGMSGGTFALNMLAVGGDGMIYAGNLTLQATTDPFKIYSWATEASTPSVAYIGTPLVGGRVGDTLATIGSGSATRIVAGFGSTPSVAGNNGYAVIDPSAGTATQVTFSGTPPAAGDFRLGLTFTDASHVLGTQGGSAASPLRYTSFSSGTGTLLASPALTQTAGQRFLLAYAVVGGLPLLAAENTGTATVSIFDMTDPTNPQLLGSMNNTTGTLGANNGTGELAWGNISGNSAELYALSANQGIEAFVVTVPEPSSVALGLAGVGFLIFWQRWRTPGRP